MTYKELFENLKKGAKWDIGVSINRTNPLPLDQYSIFESLEALQTYATSNAVAYPGQIVAVLATTIKEEDGVQKNIAIARGDVPGTKKPSKFWTMPNAK